MKRLLSYSPSKKTIAFWLLIPHLAGVMVFYLIPFVWSVFQSFDTASGIGIENYIALFGNEAFRLAIGNTLLLTLFTVPLLIVVSLAVALYVHQFMKSGFLVLHAFVLNYAIPTASIAYVWTLLFGDFGFVNVWLGRFLGMPYHNWHDGILLYVPVVSFFLLRYAAYPIIIFIGGLQALPRPVYEAASIDGASRTKKFLYLTLPLLIPEILFIAILGFFFNFKMYKEAYALFGAYPPKVIYLVQHFMNNQFQKLNLDTLTASATVMALAIAVVIYLLIRMNRSAFFQS